MAWICNKGIKCQQCSSFRYDEDRGENVCWGKQDEESGFHTQMVRYAASGHPAPWAIFDANEKLLNEALENEDLCEAFDSIFIGEAESDPDREARNLLDMYRRSSKEQRMIIDAVLVFLCGWSLPSLLEMARDRRTTVSRKHEEETPSHGH